MFTTKNLLILVGRHALIAFGAVVIALIATTFLSREITRMADTVIKNRALAASLEKRTELLSTLKRDTETVGNNDTLIEHAFVPSDNILEFVTALKALAQRNAITQSFHFDTPSASTVSAPIPLATISYSNSISGSIATFSGYFKEFERLPYFTKIESMSITASSKDGWRGAGTASFRATVETRATQ